MKVKASVKPRCEHCYFIRRRDGKGRVRIGVRCKRDPRHKQNQG